MESISLPSSKGGKDGHQNLIYLKFKHFYYFFPRGPWNRIRLGPMAQRLLEANVHLGKPADGHAASQFL
jgi:hypothetical protein